MFPKANLINLKDVPEPHRLIFGVAKTSFGDILIATLNDMVCCLHFITPELRTKTANENVFKKSHPKATITENRAHVQKLADKIFKSNDKENSIDVLLNGTNFQNAVWDTLNKVPSGVEMSYSQLAQTMGIPKSVRAVASAVARNEVAVLIPCHRIISKNGDRLKYRWGGDVKLKLLDYESKN